MDDLKGRLSHLPPEKQRHLLDMLPTHLADAGRTGHLERLLTNFDFIEAKVSSLGTQPLIDDYELSDDGTLRVIQNALYREAHVLAEHPELLWQQLYNRLQWEDVPVSQLLADELEHRSLPGATPWLRLRTPLLESPALIRTLTGHTDRVTCCVFSPDGTTILSASGEPHPYILETHDHTLRLWDAQTGQEKAILPGHTRGIAACAFSPDGTTIISRGEDKTIKLWNIKTGQVRLTIQTGQRNITACSFGLDGTTIVSANRDGTIKLWDACTGQKRTTIHTISASDCVISHDGTKILSACGGNLETLKVWDIRTGRRLVTIHTSHKDRILACAFSLDGTTIVSASEDCTLKLWDAQTGQERATLIGHTGPVLACAFSPDGTTIVSASWDHSLKLWDAQTGQERATLIGHIGHVFACAFCPDGTTIVSASEDRTLKLWKAQIVQGRAMVQGELDEVKSCAFSPDGTTIVSASGDHTLKLWDAQTRQERATLVGLETGDVLSCAFSPDGTTIASTSTGGSWAGLTWNGLKLWDVQTGRQRSIEMYVSACAFSPDGTTILSDSHNYKLKLRSVLNGRTLASIRAGSYFFRFLFGIGLGSFRQTTEVSACAFSPDGTIILAATIIDKLTLWDVQTLRKRATIYTGHTDIIRACIFSPDGTIILSASDDHTLKLWDTQTGQQRATLIGHIDRVTACAFSPDGTIIFSVSHDRTLKLWDARTGQERTTLPLEGSLSFLTVHPWQPYLVTCGEADHLYLVDLVGIIYGPLVVTAIDQGSGPRLRCPHCRQILMLDERQLGTDITCLQRDCARLLHINPFVIKSFSLSLGTRRWWQLAFEEQRNEKQR